MRWRRTSIDLRSDYEIAGRAAAAQAVSQLPEIPHQRVAAFFDIDNTVMRGASIFHLARGVASRKLLRTSEIANFAWKQTKFLASGSENLEDMKEATEAALAFVKGRRVSDVLDFAEEIFDERMVQKLWPGTLALARDHIKKGDQVWLVSTTPVEVGKLITDRLGLTGALGTVSEISQGVYTGRLVGLPLHGPAKAEAVKALAEKENMDLHECYAYSDSFNDIPMLSLVGKPSAINPDRKLASYAKKSGWPIHDFRRRKNLFKGNN